MEADFKTKSLTVTKPFTFLITRIFKYNSYTILEQTKYLMRPAMTLL